MAAPFGNSMLGGLNWLMGRGSGNGITRLSPPATQAERRAAPGAPRDTLSGDSGMGRTLPIPQDANIESVPDWSYAQSQMESPSDYWPDEFDFAPDPYWPDEFDFAPDPTSTGGSAGSSGGSGIAGLGMFGGAGGGFGAAQNIGAGVTQPTQKTAIVPNGVNWWNTQWRRTPTMQQGLDAWLLGNYMTGPADMAQQATDAIGQQLNMNADRNHQRGMLNDILSAVGNIGGGSGPRMQGFQDIRTGQGAALPGTTQSSITAGALGAPRIQQAASTARGAGQDTTAPTAGLRIPAGAQAELDARYATSMNNRGNQNATAVDRYAAGQNAGLKRGAETAAAGQGVRNASWLVGQNAQNVQNDSRLKNALLRKAMPIAGMG